jgi:hypothetical protein
MFIIGDAGINAPPTDILVHLGSFPKRFIHGYRLRNG